MITNNVIKATWSGKFPCLCSGEWSLIINGVDYSDKIPDKLRHSEMNTFGTYNQWHFDDDYSEEWDSYEDGLHADEWIKENHSWLSQIAPDEMHTEIYDAFNQSDWRHGECGGCI